MNIVEKIKEIVRPIIEKEGFKLYDVEIGKEFGDMDVIVLVDSSTAMDIDTITKISESVSNEMDKHDSLIKGEYNLSVASAGVEREIKSVEQMNDAIGKHIFVILKDKQEGISDIYGDLVEFDGTTLKIQYKFKTRTMHLLVNYNNIKFARFAIKF